VWLVATDSAGAGGVDWPAARDEATAVLGEVLSWRLTEPEWEQVTRAVAEVAAAIQAPSTDELWRTTEELQLHGALRVKIRLGEKPPELPAPKALRDRVAELVESLARSADGECAGGRHDG
jgi:hypothetical protein